jgi:hypothetical protein
MTMRTLAQALFAVALVVGGACKDSAEGSPQAQADRTPAASAGESSAGGEAESGLPAAEKVLERAVEAAGGRATLDAVESFYLAGQISIPGQNIEGNIEIWWKGGDFYTEQQMHGIGKLRAGKSGSTIWSDDPINGLRRLEGAEAEQHTWASSLLPAADWKRYFETAETVEQREVEGATVLDVKLTSGSGAEVVMTFDADTGLQVQQKYEQVTPMGKMPVSVKLQDYREVDGIKIAFEQVTDATLAKAMQTITKVELNLDVDTSTFAMPAANHETVKKDTLMPFDADGKPGKPVPTEP